jgi:hypothetical protein
MRNKIQNARVKASPVVLIVAILSLFGTGVHAQVTVALSPVAKQQFFSATGVPLTSGCIYTYAGGTTTFLATYVDSTGTSQNTNPIQLDSGGFANIWLTGSAYKFAVWSNPSGAACPGTPGGALVPQYTVDNITTATGAGSGAATSVVSAGANPATSGIIQMTKSDTVCWRNAGNSGNLCASLDAANNLTWTGGSLALSEIAAPSGVSGEDIIWADSAAHRLKQSGNGGAAKQLVNAGADINTSDQVTVTHLAAALPVAQGGTGVTTSTGSGNAVLSTSPALTTPQIGGVTISNVPDMQWNAFVCERNICSAGPPTNTAVSLLGLSFGGIKIQTFRAALQNASAGCGTNEVWQIYDETAAGNVAGGTITFANGTATYNVSVGTNVATGHVLDLRITTPPVGCSPFPGPINFTVEYAMQ